MVLLAMFQSADGSNSVQRKIGLISDIVDTIQSIPRLDQEADPERT